MTKQPFHPRKLYPEFAEITPHFETIFAEVLPLRAAMSPILDRRSDQGSWTVLPLRAEEEDQSAFPEEVCRRNRGLVPKTAEVLEAVPVIQAYAFSAVRAGGRILPHKHEKPFVTASLCLQDGGNSFLVVAGERRNYRRGELLIFDYTLEHEVINLGHQDRIVLLMLIENRWAGL